MVAVEPVLNHVAVGVQLVQDEVSVVLLRSCIDHNLKTLGHFMQKLSTEGPHPELVTPDVEVHESLVEI